VTHQPKIGEFQRQAVAPAAELPLSPGAAAIHSFMGIPPPAPVAAPPPAPLTAPPPAPTDLFTPPAEVQATSRLADIEKTLDNLDKSKEYTYAERLKPFNLSLDDALEIMSMLFDKGYYEKSYRITPRHTVVFRTRMTADTDRILKKIESDNPQYPATIAQLVAKANLTASLVKFNASDLTTLEYTERQRRVEMLPDAVLRLLAMYLEKFDSMILAVMSEGSVENF